MSVNIILNALFLSPCIADPPGEAGCRRGVVSVDNGHQRASASQCAGEWVVFGRQNLIVSSNQDSDERFEHMLKIVTEMLAKLSDCNHVSL